MANNGDLVVPDLKIRGLIENILAGHLQRPQSIIPRIDCLGGGMYARTGYLKAGIELVGKIHKLEHINIMSFGDITILTEEGARRYTGFNIMVCKPGTRRAGHVHADTVWTTILRTDETDIKKIEEMFFYKNHEEMESEYVC